MTVDFILNSEQEKLQIVSYAFSQCFLRSIVAKAAVEPRSSKSFLEERIRLHRSLQMAIVTSILLTLFKAKTQIGWYGRLCGQPQYQRVSLLMV